MAMFYAPNKQPREELTYSIDKSGFREIQRGEKIVSAEVIIADKKTGDEMPDVYVSHDIDEGGQIVNVRVKGGEHKKEYVITVLVTTDAGHVRESDVVMPVKELP